MIPKWRLASTISLVLKSLSAVKSTDFLAEYHAAYTEARDLVEREASSYLDEDGVHQFLNALDGAILYSETLLRTVFEDSWEAIDIHSVNNTVDHFLRADLLLVTAFLVINHDLRSDDSTDEVASPLSSIVEEAASQMETLEDRLRKTSTSSLNLKPIPSLTNVSADSAAMRVFIGCASGTGMF